MVDRLEKEYRRYLHLVELAERYFAAGDLRAAIGIAQIALKFCFLGNGLFSCPRLERLIFSAGQRLQLPTSQRPTRDASSRRRVLHVLTYARPLGGDSRFAWRWMQRDAGSIHSVVVTSPSVY